MIARSDRQIGSAGWVVSLTLLSAALTVGAQAQTTPVSDKMPEMVVGTRRVGGSTNEPPKPAPAPAPPPTAAPMVPSPSPVIKMPLPEVPRPEPATKPVRSQPAPLVETPPPEPPIVHRSWSPPPESSPALRNESLGRRYMPDAVVLLFPGTPTEVSKAIRWHGHWGHCSGLCSAMRLAPNVPDGAVRTLSAASGVCADAAGPLKLLASAKRELASQPRDEAIRLVMSTEPAKLPVPDVMPASMTWPEHERLTEIESVLPDVRSLAETEPRVERVEHVVHAPATAVVDKPLYVTVMAQMLAVLAALTIFCGIILLAHFILIRRNGGSILPLFRVEVVNQAPYVNEGPPIPVDPPWGKHAERAQISLEELVGPAADEAPIEPNFEVGPTYEDELAQREQAAEQQEQAVLQYIAEMNQHLRDEIKRAHWAEMTEPREDS